MAEPDPAGAVIDAEEDLCHGATLGERGRKFNPSGGVGRV
jgi:hypothetical protein